jgi:16S rRNA U516 pseudouridylate synthase RsuA-like enzyme
LWLSRWRIGGWKLESIQRGQKQNAREKESAS